MFNDWKSSEILNLVLFHKFSNDLQSFKSVGPMVG